MALVPVSHRLAHAGAASVSSPKWMLSLERTMIAMATTKLKFVLDFRFYLELRSWRPTWWGHVSFLLWSAGLSLVYLCVCECVCLWNGCQTLRVNLPGLKNSWCRKKQSSGLMGFVLNFRVESSTFMRGKDGFKLLRVTHVTEKQLLTDSLVKQLVFTYHLLLRYYTMYGNCCYWNTLVPLLKDTL